MNETKCKHMKYWRSMDGEIVQHIRRRFHIQVDDLCRQQYDRPKHNSPDYHSSSNAQLLCLAHTVLLPAPKSSANMGWTALPIP